MCAQKAVGPASKARRTAEAGGPAKAGGTAKAGGAAKAGAAANKATKRVADLKETLERYNYSKLYGAWPGFVVSGDAKLALRRSAERYLRAIGDCKPLESAHPTRRAAQE